MHHASYTKLDIVDKTKKLAELLVAIEENYTNYLWHANWIINVDLDLIQMSQSGLLL